MVSIFFAENCVFFSVNPLFLLLHRSLSPPASVSQPAFLLLFRVDFSFLLSTFLPTHMGSSPGFASSGFFSFSFSFSFRAYPLSGCFYRPFSTMPIPLAASLSGQIRLFLPAFRFFFLFFFAPFRRCPFPSESKFFRRKKLSFSNSRWERSPTLPGSNFLGASCPPFQSLQPLVFLGNLSPPPDVGNVIFPLPCE